MQPNRRIFLKTAGVSLALPSLSAFGSEDSVTEPTPKRMIMICTSLGLHSPFFFPKEAGEDYTPSNYLKLIDKHRKQFTVFSGLSHPDQSGADGHSSQMTWLTGAPHPGLGGFRNSISIDQAVRQELGYVTRFPSVVLSTDSGSSQSYTSNGVMVPSEWRPSVIFQKMFLQGKPREIARQRAKLGEGRSILDSLANQRKRVRSRVNSADRNKLDEYFTSLRDAEKRLHKAEQWLDVPKPEVDAEIPVDVQQANDLLGRAELIMELIPLMIQTDSTRMITLLVQGRNDVPPVEGVTIDHHNLSHHGQDQQKIEQLMKIESGVMNSLNLLLEGLSAKEEAGGTLLDNTMVCFGSNLGNANSHDWRNLPVILAGGKFKHGSHIQFDRENNKPLGKLFVTMMQQMGLEIDQFANASGTLSW